MFAIMLCFSNALKHFFFSQRKRQDAHASNHCLTKNVQAKTKDELLMCIKIIDYYSS